MDINKLKKLAKEHDEYSHKLDVINCAVSSNNWVKVITPRGGEFCLSKEEIEALRAISLNKSKEIEKVVNELSEE